MVSKPKFEWMPWPEQLLTAPEEHLCLILAESARNYMATQDLSMVLAAVGLLAANDVRGGRKLGLEPRLHAIGLMDVILCGLNWTALHQIYDHAYRGYSDGNQV